MAFQQHRLKANPHRRDVTILKHAPHNAMRQATESASYGANGKRAPCQLASSTPEVRRAGWRRSRNPPLQRTTGHEASGWLASVCHFQLKPGVFFVFGLRYFDRDPFSQSIEIAEQAFVSISGKMPP